MLRKSADWEERMNNGPIFHQQKEGSEKFEQKKTDEARTDFQPKKWKIG